jgi:hypothetical protein
VPADWALLAEVPPVTMTCTGWPHAADPVTITARMPSVCAAATIGPCTHAAPVPSALQVQPLASGPFHPAVRVEPSFRAGPARTAKLGVTVGSGAAVGSGAGGGPGVSVGSGAGIGPGASGEPDISVEPAGSVILAVSCPVAAGPVSVMPKVTSTMLLNPTGPDTLIWAVTWAAGDLVGCGRTGTGTGIAGVDGDDVGCRGDGAGRDDGAGEGGAGAWLGGAAGDAVTRGRAEVGDVPGPVVDGGELGELPGLLDAVGELGGAAGAEEAWAGALGGPAAVGWPDACCDPAAVRRVST